MTLLAFGADVNWANPEAEHRTALMVAAEKGSLATVEYLSQNNAKVSCVTDDGRSAMDLALAGGFEDVHRLLLKRQLQ